MWSRTRNLEVESNTPQPQKLELKQMVAKRTRKSPRSILGVCEERFIAVQRSKRCLKRVFILLPQILHPQAESDHPAARHPAVRQRLDRLVRPAVPDRYLAKQPAMPDSTLQSPSR